MAETVSATPTPQPSQANFEVAQRLLELAAYLEILGENAFKIRAYRSAAQTLESLPEPVERLLANGSLDDLPGFGAAIVAKTRDIVATGTTKALEDARRKLPASLLEIVGLPGIGPKIIQQLYTLAGVDSAASLAAAIESHALRSLPGMGEKTEAKLKDALDRHARYSRQMLISDARELGASLIAPLAAMRDVSTAALCGDARRGVETVGELVVVAATSDAAAAFDLFATHARGTAVLERSDHWVSVALAGGFRATLVAVSAERFGSAVLAATGSAAHVAHLNRIAGGLGLSITADGLVDSSGRQVADGDDERQIYRALGMEFIVPELREDRGEIEAALSGTLPRLVHLGDLRGDLHAHTSATDGKATVEEMVKAAMERGYEYCAITDHSQSLAVASGLSVERLRAQVALVREVSDRLGFPVLAGSECDIRADGTMDFPDEVLASLDFVIGSVHSRFRQTQEEMTARIVRAIENPHVDMIAHPTGRLLNQREPYAVDLDQVFAAASRTGTGLEINSYPDRQDLSAENARAAKDAGVRLMINTDAHAPGQYALIEYGISVAQRAWLEPNDVLNTLPLSALHDWLSR